MTVQMLSTKAEQAILASFEANAAKLPGGAAVAALRRAAIGAFASKGLPSRRVEEFKYTDLKANVKDVLPLATGGGTGDAATSLGAHFGPEFAANAVVFADGRGVAAKAGVTCLADTLGNAPDWVAAALADAELSASSDLLLNTALFSDGAVIDIAAGAEVAEPIVIVATATDNAMTALRHVIRVGAGAKATIVEIERAPEGSGARQSSALTQIAIGDGAEVVHIKVVETHKGSLHLSHWQVNLGANVTYKPFQMTLGEGLARNGLNVLFNGQHSTFDYGAASIVHGTGHADSSLIVDHKVPHCTSRELFKTVLDGQARAVFQGRVIVRPNAQKTDGKQMAQALMLSPDAEFDSKPELEIYADDVVCGHGSTAAEIDPDLVFYCTSRGIPTAVARGLLIESFIGEAIDKVEHEGLREALGGIARDSLTA
ncbi:MAG: Fe-S cluster assembly protein SufD [Hyphomicrobium sp. 32-62-53]|nr:MAG: Fe-S cluster assembly protein SufD [Hyphomicrobium sp. 12-62-95]OYY00665.1 MAG: Fe-S cluster assembly protein SufD [Hyphomicrobium sp. 32-62-53]